MTSASYACVLVSSNVCCLIMEYTDLIFSTGYRFFGNLQFTELRNQILVITIAVKLG